MTIRIDFGRLFPGLLILLVGIGFFVLWLVFVLISFFAFFVPGLGGIFYFTLDLLIASLVLVGSGLLIMFAGVSGWSHFSGRGGGGEGWLSRVVTRRVSRDRMRLSERGGEIFGVFISALVLLFFIENQIRGTGLFTGAFGPTEQALFYGAWFVGAVVSLARAVYGRRNALRPFEALYDGVLAVTAFWLLQVFPFNFAHLPDLLPDSVRFAFFWVSNPIGAAVLVLAGIGSAASLIYVIALYASVRDRLVHQRMEGTGSLSSNLG